MGTFSGSGPGERGHRIPLDGIELVGDLLLPRDPTGLVLFAHGSGSSRRSPRNRQVASALQGAGLATLLFDLLTEDEEAEDRLTARWRFDVGLLTNRLVGATDWALRQREIAALPLGYFGSSTGSAAALVAAARRPSVVRAVVSRGGRPDLASFAIDQVQAPTLLIVGGADTTVLDLNQDALVHLRCPKDLAIVLGASHLFEEPGALEQVAVLAAKWFLKHLAIQEWEARV